MYKVMSKRAAALGGFVIAAGLFGSGLAKPTYAVAADDGYANVFSSMATAFGVIKADPGPDIAYRERPPLVLPPQAGLPKPVDAAPRTAAWPNDPDVARHRKELEEARAPRISPDIARDDQVSQAELAKGRVAGGAPVGPRADCNPDSNNRNCLLLSPDELKRQGDEFAAANPTTSEETIAGQEPERVYLTQPPKGYLKATKTTKATAQAPIVKADESNPRSFLTPSPKSDE